MSGIYGFDDTAADQFTELAAKHGVEDTALPAGDGWTDSASWKGAGDAVAEGIAREAVFQTAQKGALVMSAAPILGDKIYSAVTGEEETRGQDWYFKNVVDPTKNAIDHFTPDPDTTGHAAQVVGGLVGGISQLATGGSVNMLSNMFSGQSMDLMDQGVDVGTAESVAGIQTAATGATFALLPGYGSTLAKQMASGAAINVASNTIGTAASSEVLESQGYDKQAKQYNWRDVEGRVIDAVMGAAFGGYNHLHVNVRPATRAQKDAAATLAQAKHLAVETAPGDFASEKGFAAHQSNMDTATEAVLKGEDIDPAKLRDVDYTPRELDADALEAKAGAEEVLQSHMEQDVPEQRFINPDEEAARVFSKKVAKRGLDENQAAVMAKYSQPEVSPVAGRYSDRELLGAVERASESDMPMRYVEMDTSKLGKINAKKGANDAADDFIRDVGDVLQGAYGDHPVYHRGAGRFAALVPEGFDIEAAQAQAKEALKGVTEKHDVSDLGVDMYHGDSPIVKGEKLDKSIKPAQDKLNASKPEDTSDVAGIEGLEAWSRTSGGSARETAGRIRQAIGDLRPETEGVERTARDIAKTLEREPTATEVKQAGKFLSPEDHLAKSFEQDVKNSGIDEKAAKDFTPKMVKDDLTGAYRAADRDPTIKRVQEYIQETGEPAVFAVADVSNLGGKNIALGQHVADVIFRQYHEIILDNLHALGGDVIPFRHGGDETSYIVVGIEEPLVKEAMAKAAADVQRYVNRVGIADLPHKKTYTKEVSEGKAERDLSKDGSGIYVGVKGIIPGDTPREIYRAGDRVVDAEKSAGKANVGSETMPLKSDKIQGYAASPEVQQALDSADGITVLDDDGNPVSARDAILQAAKEVDDAAQLAEGFKAAALCAMRFV